MRKTLHILAVFAATILGAAGVRLLAGTARFEVGVTSTGAALLGTGLISVAFLGAVISLANYPLRSRVELLSPSLKTERMPSGRRKLVRDLVLEIDGQRWTVPAGTETDYSSIPPFGRFLVRWSRVDLAGVVHDWLYQTAAVSRRRADRMWYKVAISGERHANFLQAGIAWLALRGFGWWAWHQHRRTQRSR